MSQPALEVHDLSVSYTNKPVLWDVDLTLEQGQLVGVVGPNGAGKSTLIKAVLGLIPINSGWVKFFGKPLEESRGVIAYVPQRGSVDWDFPVNAYDVVMMGRYGRLGLFARPGKEDHAAVRRCLEEVGMLEYANRQISDLSGGQQQRVFLARALAQEGLIYLLDEPFVGVDAATEGAIIDLLRALKARGRLTVVVHHNLDTVTDYFDHVLLLNMRVVGCGPTEKIFTPHLIRKTYGGRLTLLSEAAEEVGR
ncbi:MAG: metal ABC transporter ATP-binding protein [Armatimonadetes bacterium]|nr:metal ABC transporter ATP-binding protein [Armatimonadota bacterium]